VVLFALGGVAQIERDATDARTEFWMGIVGPLVSAAMGVLCLGSARLLGWVPDSEAATPLHAVLVWLGYINAMLALFNLIPGFPLDGGRVLRGILWGATGDPLLATRAAAFMGELVGCGLMAWGCLAILAGAGVGGLWLVFIGWFLLESARATNLRSTLPGEGGRFETAQDG